jgi:hypothetical protein
VNGSILPPGVAGGIKVVLTHATEGVNALSPALVTTRGKLLMRAWILPPVAGLIEPTKAPVICIDTIGAIWIADGIVTTYYASEQPSLFGDGTEKTVEVIVKRPLHRVFEGMGQFARLAEFISGRPSLVPDMRPPGGFHPHLVT